MPPFAFCVLYAISGGYWRALTISSVQIELRWRLRSQRAGKVRLTNYFMFTFTLVTQEHVPI